MFWKTCLNWTNQTKPTQKFDNQTKTRKYGALIGQFLSRDLNTVIWLVTVSACIILWPGSLLSVNTKEIRCFEWNTENLINQIVLFINLYHQTKAQLLRALIGQLWSHVLSTTHSLTELSSGWILIERSLQNQRMDFCISWMGYFLFPCKTAVEYCRRQL